MLKHGGMQEEKGFGKSLNAIKLILKNAVLLDTEVSINDSSKKALNTMFMHKLYTSIEYDGRKYIAKISVEEFYDMGTNSIKKKVYHLRTIKIEPADGRSEGNPSTTPRSDTNSIKSVSDLFTFVKFKYKPNSLAFNDDIKKLPNAINNPIMIFEYSSVNNAYVLVTELSDKVGDAVIVAVHLNKYQKRMRVN